MTTYVFRDGCFRDKATGEPMPMPERDGVCTPMMIMKDVETHVAPSGQRITTRKQMMDDCRAHGYVPYEPVNSCPGGFTDPDTAAKAGKRVCEATTEWLDTQKKRYAAAAGTIT